jgi:hypothetical protein
MRTTRIARWAAALALASGLAACSGQPAGSPAPAGSALPPAVSSTPATSAAAPGHAQAGGGLTPPGTRLGFGQLAKVGWVPPSQATGSGSHRGIRLQITVESIVKGTIADFKNVDLTPSERKATPYYVTVKITALGSTPPPGSDDPAITFNAIDDRGQQQQSITFFGTFQRCDEVSPPKPFTNGKSYSSCLAYLLPGGGSITSVQWDDGPAAANQVTPYFDHPIVWSAG